jgi:ankyrin repeat protein
MLDLLSEAVESGSESRVLSLLASGAPLEGRDRAGDTPLLQALKLEKVAVVALLLRRGANPLARDADGKTAQEIAELSPDHRMRDLFAR